MRRERSKMKIEWSEEAAKALRDRFGTEPGPLKLVYDAEGCGCAVSGVPALWVVDAPLPDDVRAESDAFELWHERRHEIFFDEALRIGYLPDVRSFSLVSDTQIYTNRLAVLDRRSTAAKA